MPDLSLVRGLDRFYVPTRYPDAWARDAPSRHCYPEDAKEAIAQAERLVGRVVRFAAAMERPPGRDGAADEIPDE